MATGATFQACIHGTPISMACSACNGPPPHEHHFTVAVEWERGWILSDGTWRCTKPVNWESVSASRVTRHKCTTCPAIEVVDHG